MLTVEQQRKVIEFAYKNGAEAHEAIKHCGWIDRDDIEAFKVLVGTGDWDFYRTMDTLARDVFMDTMTDYFEELKELHEM